MEDHLMCRRKRLKLSHKKPAFRQRSALIQFSDIPVDVLGTILSKLPQKEVVRTSVLSNECKHIWTVCPKLRFDGAEMCGQDASGTEQHTQMFIDNVNGVLKQYHSKVVEEFGVKFEFDATLAEHLDCWVNFALSSRAKNLALDLLPARWGLRPDRYRFPVELFDGESISRLQHLQLSFVSFEPSSQFCGFPNLKKLDLHVVSVTRKGLEDMLSNCSNLEWLSIVRCHLDNDELRARHRLPRLLYLHIAYCEISKIEFIAMNLQTFVFRGKLIHFYLWPALALKDVKLYNIGDITLNFALTALPFLFPRAQNMVLHCSLPLKTPWPQGNGSKFSLLKYLQLKVLVSPEDLANLLSLASLLSAAPSIEKLEIHFSICTLPPHGSELIRSVPGSTHRHLKNLSITGFTGCTGQVELLLHIVENTPNLEALTIDRVNHYGNTLEYVRQSRSKALDIARRHLNGRLSENTKVSIM